MAHHGSPLRPCVLAIAKLIKAKHDHDSINTINHSKDLMTMESRIGLGNLLRGAMLFPLSLKEPVESAIVIFSI